MKFHEVLQPVTEQSLLYRCCTGNEAQTLANVYLALDHDLDVMPVINKIDLPSADPERVKEEIEDVIGIDAGCTADFSKNRTECRTGSGADREKDSVTAGRSGCTTASTDL